MSANKFSSLHLSPEMHANIESLGFTAMTEIQARSLPEILQGRDIIAQAKTGSGKTAAFGIGLLTRLDVSRFQTQSLVLCPTRELADQVAKEIRRLARFTHNIKVLTLCGGMPFGPQIGSLEHGAHIIVGTPGRIGEHLRKGNLKLGNINTLVLDEADRMLDMGFQDILQEIISYVPDNRQTQLFSATYPDNIRALSASIQTNPLEVRVEAIHADTKIEQLFFEIDKHQREEALFTLLGHYRPRSSVVFCNTKQMCQDVATYLQQQGYHARAIHGDLTQKERDQVLLQFANGSSSVLVATDVAARGLDIKSLDAVINFELSRDPEVHVHRIGRTGRAENSGLALSLCPPSESYKMGLIEDYLEQQITIAPALPHAHNQEPLSPEMVTLAIDGGKKNKVRPGDILGALTGDAGIPGNQIGKIDLFPFHSYVAVNRSMANKALKRLSAGKIKGRSFKVRRLR